VAMSQAPGLSGTPDRGHCPALGEQFVRAHPSAGQNQPG
jgi:hypothetical protein